MCACVCIIVLKTDLIVCVVVDWATYLLNFLTYYYTFVLFLVHIVSFSCKTQFFSSQILKIAKNKLTAVFFQGGSPWTPLFTGRYSVPPKPPEGASVKDS